MPMEPYSTTKVEMICFCGNQYTAKVADLKRGWGKSCSKSCAAKRRDKSLANPKFVNPDQAFNIKGGGKAKRARKNPPNDKRYEERLRAKDEMAKQCGYYPFDSENEMYDAMCDNPAEGR